MRIIGSVLRHCSQLELSTADEKHYTLKTTPVSKLALGLIGIPHLGFRGRARVILDEADKAIRSDSKVLDAGCGFGIYSLTLATEGHAIDSIDLDPIRTKEIGSMLHEIPGTEGRVNLFTGSLTSLPFASAAYDIAICSEVIEHIADHEKAIAELGRVLKPGGTLILSVPYDSKYNQRIYRSFGHERPGYTRESLSAYFKKAGLTIQTDSYYEYKLGTFLFRTFNKISYTPLMAALFYPFYLLYRIDALWKIGQPNGIIVTAKKA